MFGMDANLLMLAAVLGLCGVLPAAAALACDRRRRPEWRNGPHLAAMAELVGIVAAVRREGLSPCTGDGTVATAEAGASPRRIRGMAPPA